MSLTLASLRPPTHARQSPHAPTTPPPPQQRNSTPAASVIPPCHQCPANTAACPVPPSHANNAAVRALHHRRRDNATARPLPLPPHRHTAAPPTSPQQCHPNNAAVHLLLLCSPTTAQTSQTRQRRGKPTTTNALPFFSTPPHLTPTMLPCGCCDAAAPTTDTRHAQCCRDHCPSPPLPTLFDE
jgi:hypothetical protein